MTTTLPISLTIAAAAALINVWLGFRVSQLRLRDKESVGDAGNERLRCRMRAHSNYIEYTPIFLILLALVELAVGPKGWLWGVGIAYVLARLAHPFGMERAAPNPFRAGGIFVTWAVLIGLAAYAISISYSEQRQPQINRSVA